MQSHIVLAILLTAGPLISTLCQRITQDICPVKVSYPASEGNGRCGDMAAFGIFIVSNSYYGMFRSQISIYFPPKHPIIAI